jgi:serine/threonine-protein kinase/endoribonuclease IRE1
MAIFRYYAIELCAASLDKLFFSDESAKKYRGPAMPLQIDVFLQLATGLEYIHKEKVIHRDIKPQNILIWVNPEQEDVLLKWADFGLSKQLKETESYTMSTIGGTEGWSAPEILKILEYEETNLTEFQAKQRGTVKSDVFSEGLVFGYYLLRGRHLFGGLPQQYIFNNNPVRLNGKSLHLKYRVCSNTVIRYGITNYFSLTDIQWEIGRKLIKKMIRADPKERISSSDVAKELRDIKSDLG